MTPATLPRASSPDRCELDPTPMTRLGRYIVLGLLGRGGMGVVYSAYDELLQRRVAIKQIHRGVDKPVRRRSLLEAQALARSAHPNIITIYEVFEIGDQPYIVMEFVAGQTLREWLTEASPDWNRILGVLQQAGRGIAAAHAGGLVHRDLTPDNIMLGEDGRVRVMDFGLARMVGQGHEPLEFEVATIPDAPSDGAATDSEACVGTPGYVAPEHGLAVDPRSDIFSFCVLAFEALHGVRPFVGRSNEELFKEILAGQITAAVRKSVPAWLDAVVRRGLAAEPDARWPSMDAMLEGLTSGPLLHRCRRTPMGLARAGKPESAHSESGRRLRARQIRLSQ